MERYFAEGGGLSQLLDGQSGRRKKRARLTCERIGQRLLRGDRLGDGIKVPSRFQRGRCAIGRIQRRGLLHRFLHLPHGRHFALHAGRFVIAAARRSAISAELLLPYEFVRTFPAKEI